MENTIAMLYFPSIDRSAAAKIEIEGTDVCWSTIHALFDLDATFQSKLDFARFDNPKVKALMDMQLLLLDEVVNVI